MTFLIEKTVSHSEFPHLTHRKWRFKSAALAAYRFESEASPRNWLISQIAAELQMGNFIRHADHKTGVEVTGRRVDD